MNQGFQPYQLEPRRPTNGNLRARTPELVENLEQEDREWRKNDNSWCECKRCDVMAAAEECRCCREIDNISRTMEQCEHGLACILDHPEFPIICLHRGVLRTALIARSDIRRNDLQDPIEKNAYRLCAYRQFTYWVHDRLGKGVRRVIPACVVTRIREEFPSADGTYEGFKEAEPEA